MPDFWNYIDPAGGIIYGADNYPDRPQSPGEVIENMVQWSDAVGWGYAKFAPETPLKAVVQMNICNQETLMVISEAVAKVEKGTQMRWTREENKEVFDALLGTPIGRGAGYLQIDFQHTIGHGRLKITLKSIHYTHDFWGLNHMAFLYRADTMGGVRTPTSTRKDV